MRHKFKKGDRVRFTKEAIQSLGLTNLVNNYEVIEINHDILVIKPGKLRCNGYTVKNNPDFHFSHFIKDNLRLLFTEDV